MGRKRDSILTRSLKVCLHCKEEKTLDNFALHGVYYNARCKICINEYNRTRYEAKPTYKKVVKTGNTNWIDPFSFIQKMIR